MRYIVSSLLQCCTTSSCESAYPFCISATLIWLLWGFFLLVCSLKGEKTISVLWQDNGESKRKELLQAGDPLPGRRLRRVSRVVVASCVPPSSETPPPTPTTPSKRLPVPRQLPGLRPNDHSVPHPGQPRGPGGPTRLPHQRLQLRHPDTQRVSARRGQNHV